MNFSDFLADEANDAHTVALVFEWTAVICGIIATGIGLIVLSNRSKTAGKGWMIRVACTFVMVFTGWYVAETAANYWIRQHAIADESRIVFLQTTIRLVTLIVGGLITGMALRKSHRASLTGGRD